MHIISAPFEDRDTAQLGVQALLDRGVTQRSIRMQIHASRRMTFGGLTTATTASSQEGPQSGESGSPDTLEVRFTRAANRYEETLKDGAVIVMACVQDPVRALALADKLRAAGTARPTPRPPADADVARALPYRGRSQRPIDDFATVGSSHGDVV